jgi:hypothetical protein
MEPLVFFLESVHIILELPVLSIDRVDVRVYVRVGLATGQNNTEQEKLEAQWHRDNPPIVEHRTGARCNSFPRKPKGQRAAVRTLQIQSTGV